MLAHYLWHQLYTHLCHSRNYLFFKFKKKIIGQVGIATLQFAKAYGMTVIGTAGTPEGIEVVKKNGAHFVFNHRQEGYMDQIMVSCISNFSRLVRSSYSLLT